MTAAVRSVQFNTLQAPSGTVSRGDARPGDVLLAFQSADSGGHGAMNLGGDWLLLDAYPGDLWPGSVNGTWAGVNLWKRVCDVGEPVSYTASQGPVADGVVVIVAISGAVTDRTQTANESDTTTPGLAPSQPSGVELRYVTGVPSPPGGSVSWSLPSEYTARGQAQSGVWVSGAMVSKPVVSTAPTGDVTLSPSLPLAAAAFTVFLPSAEEPVPDPPVVQPFAPGRGASKFRYVFTRLLDRTYLGDLNLTNVTFDKRILQPGAFSATIPIPNRRIGDQVAEIIPRDDTDLSIGPGVITCQIFREGEPWGEYWITSAQPSRSRRGTPAIQLRGSTLDAYLAHVEIQSDLNYSADQIDIARSLLSHLSAQAHANISLTLQPGTSGVVRDRTYLESEGASYGGRLVELAQVDDGFEWVIDLALVDGALQRQWRWGYPKLGVQSPAPHLFADGRSGGDILEWGEEIDALRGGTRWRARGATASTDASTTSTPLISDAHEATAHLAAGWPRLDRTLSYSTVSQQQTLEDYAAFWAATAPGALRVDQVTVTFGKVVTFTPNTLGDSGRFYFNNQWHRGVWRTRRIIGIGITPTSRGSGKEEARLVLEGLEVPGA
ncbi:hypothetical protein [Nonomuraea sp. NPDC049028]|uniref:hypothetical protein n=1 Tax=Nonomuraea sp. NPDC049028 TaxID=3364348 RepID=UPI00371E63B8